MRFELMDRAAVELRPQMSDPLRLYNHAQNPVFFAAREDPANAPRPMYIVLYDDAGEIAGGLIGETQFAWLKVDIVSVREDLRRQGAGTKLMRLAEIEARRRGCKYVYVDTMSYQAPEFYEKLGYETVGRIPDWDSHGHCKFHFVLAL
jgi:GNAT superfamily N-acetyltransferase